MSINLSKAINRGFFSDNNRLETTIPARGHGVKLLLMSLMFLCASAQITASASSSISLSYRAQGDREPKIRQQYPSGAFADPAAILNEQPEVIDYWDAIDDKKMLKVTDFGAVGDGKPTSATANTEAFQRMCNFLKARAIQHFGDTGRPEHPEAAGAQWIFYLPAGTYYVNNTISETGNMLDSFRGLRLIGEDRESTVIRLVDNSLGFQDAANPRAIVSFHHPQQDFNNWQGHNYLKNLTIHAGMGNPGAIGVSYFSPNTGRIDNVSIVSPGGANQYAGAIGIDFKIGVVHGYFTNLTVEGFDIGMRFEPYHLCHPTLEYITLRQQKKAAILATNGGASLREIYSFQSRADDGADAVGILIDSGSNQSAGSQVVIIDSQFVSERVPASTRSALEVRVRNSNDGQVSGQLFARRVSSSGYVSGVKMGNTRSDGPDVTEFHSHAPIGFAGEMPQPSMNLPVEEVPAFYVNNNPADWISPEDFPAAADDTAAVEAALNSGKPVIYFPEQQYYLTRPLKVPASVKRIDLMATMLETFQGMGAFFEVTEDSTDPLLIHDLNQGNVPLLRLSGRRDIVLDGNRNSAVRFEGNYEGRLFVNSGGKFLRAHGSLEPLQNAMVWCRFINTEDKDNPNWTVGAGGVMWVLGYKCEGDTINFLVEDGGILEVLGGMANQFGYRKGLDEWFEFNDPNVPERAAVVNNNGHLSFIGYTSGPSSLTVGFQRLVSDFQGDDLSLIERNDLPRRFGRNGQYFVPLYNNYDPAVLPEPFDIFLKRYRLDPQSPGIAEADPDGDSRSNLLEFVLGSHPLVPDQGHPLTLARGSQGASHELQLVVSLGSLNPGGAFLIERSSDLLLWENALVDPVPPNSGDDPFLPLQRNFALDPLPFEAATFFRLRATGE